MGRLRSRGPDCLHVPWVVFFWLLVVAGVAAGLQGPLSLATCAGLHYHDTLCATLFMLPGDGGCVTVTDDDVIEKSNLSRQFLFRNWHIGR